MNIEVQSLKHLKCADCKLPLSIGPIKVNWFNEYFCGRCSRGTASITIYEVLAKKFVFPCRYEPVGCKKVLPWGSVEKHEFYCPNAPCHCPMLTMPFCQWEGTAKNLTRHFEKDHPENVLQINSFEIDLEESKTCRKVLGTLSKDLVISYYNKPRYYLQFGIAELTDYDSFKSVKYKIKFHAYDYSNKISIDSKETTIYGMNSLLQNTIQASILEYLTTNFPIIHCEIIIKKEIKKDNRKLFKSLECPVCRECMTYPSYFCILGHTVCYLCNEQLNGCPLCLKMLTRTRNHRLQNIAKYLSHQCKNKVRGCTYRGSLEDMKTHKQTCQLYRCPLALMKNYCNWHGDFPKLLEHCKATHPFLIPENDVLIHRLLPNESDIFCAFYFSGYFFKFCILYTSCFFVSVQFVGSDDKAADFSFDFIVIDFNDNRKKLSIRNVCQTYSTRLDNSKKFVKIPFSLVEPFIFDHKFKYSINIVKNSDTA